MRNDGPTTGVRQQPADRNRQGVFLVNIRLHEPKCRPYVAPDASSQVEDNDVHPRGEPRDGKGIPGDRVAVVRRTCRLR
ncbi:hypothetical protein ACN26Y_28770 [Micromonospora sp. WMMD558]|uniref:hypothetical protein n=1 Tax=Micromonospora sp. WMMD558 TaxID=3403462 RepID=UPI003BF56E67